MSSIEQKIEKEFSKSFFLSDDESRKVYSKDWTNYFDNDAILICFPTSTLEAQKLIQFCIKEKISIVPSGGRTGLSGAAVSNKDQLVVSFERMNKILNWNEEDQLVRLQPGVVTAQLQEFAEDKGYFYPIEFGATGSSQIGGNVATNAGGVHVLKYGLTRQWVYGLEIVTGSGDILSLNNGLTKNATGYDLRHLIIGSEGSLGLITEVTVKLAKKPREKSVFLFGLDSWKKCTRLFNQAYKELDISAFEVFSDDALEYVLKQSDHEAPFESRPSVYALIECEKEDKALDNFLDTVFDAELVTDGTQSQSESQFKQLWSYRENITESISSYTPYKNDISVRSSQIPDFIDQMQKVLQSQYSDYKVIWFGHLGDGNLHINILKPEKLSREDFVANCRKVDDILFQKILEFKGSISAEHGVGLTKKSFLKYSRSETEIQIMRQIKKIFDPHNILNPGKIFDI